MKGSSFVYSLVAAFSIAAPTFFVLQQFGIAYGNLIVPCTFLFAFFSYSIDHHFDARRANPAMKLHQRHQVSEAAYRFSIRGVALTGLVSVYLFSFLPGAYLYMGLGIGLVSGLYFLLIFKGSVHKVVKQVLSAVILALVMASWIWIE